MSKVKNLSAGGQSLALKIRNLQVLVEGKKILKGIDLVIEPGEIHALMGPNGSGKTTLAFALAGHSGYKITGGEILLGRRRITDLAPEERAKAGLFLAFQHSIGVEGVSLFHFLRTALASRGQKNAPATLLTRLEPALTGVGLEKGHLKRDLNFNFSGGEKKRSEVLQALVLRPKFAVFDETDSGLDVDALKLVAGKIKGLAEEGAGILVITHYQRIFRYLVPDFVHVMVGGRIVESGEAKLAEKVEKGGYQHYG